jgi:hypothetical protein
MEISESFQLPSFRNRRTVSPSLVVQVNRHTRGGRRRCGRAEADLGMVAPKAQRIFMKVPNEKWMPVLDYTGNGLGLWLSQLKEVTINNLAIEVTLTRASRAKRVFAPLLDGELACVWIHQRYDENRNLPQDSLNQRVATASDLFSKLDERLDMGSLVPKRGSRKQHRETRTFRQFLNL